MQTPQAPTSQQDLAGLGLRSFAFLYLELADVRECTCSHG